ncbi:Type I phosphodiesterase / nucleotide pyrophosphatase [Lutibacter oricola]|uniref:Type I phosphodiesterase / nucleotide pyrophosphatase n=1 Tax=Lutibacter oricola TaxID=762486 RepID=A0A1H3GH34_9FLAO|nr:alkaline phosphatase PafA [Lutibacter oricola]SDY01958.1 Type I phosphodiesterase / nucleotide pyrophosphatase [Lutibacter oricola]
MKKYIILVLTCSLFIQCIAIKSKSSNTTIKTNSTKVVIKNKTTNPKLMIGIVVDQMRYDYLVKFHNKFGEGGFKRLMNGGYHFKNIHFNYIPTYTAVGHTSIYTGTTPVNHGIISNNWYDKYAKKDIYCVDDTNYQSVGAKNGGQKSPYRMVNTTITDQLKLAQNMKGKTIGVAIKDRSSILPAGHTANAAYWYEGKDEGKFITSSFYMKSLPKWVNDFNNSGKVNDYLNKTWNTYYNISTYTETLPDNNPYEMIFKGKNTPTFPYNYAELRNLNGNFSLINYSPYGNSITTDFAIAAIEGENLGKSEFTDFLAISYSSTDYIGHKFGVNAKETEDIYIRFDLELKRLLEYLDSNVGIDNYTLFLTADHAAVQVPSYLKDLKIPAGYFDGQDFKREVNSITQQFFGANELIENISNYQIFLNKKKINDLGLNQHTVSQKIVDEIINYKDVYKAVTAYTLQNTSYNNGILKTLQNGYNQKRSGDVLIIPFPSVVSYPKAGTTHGSGYSYDTHVPLIFYGKGIKKGESQEFHPIIDIAPTLARFLDIENPNGTTGKPILDIFK